MAVAAAAPIVEAAIANAPTIMAAGQMAAEMASKFGPKVKGAVNHLFHLGRHKKSAKSYLRKLGTRRGLSKFFQKDLGKGLHMGGRLLSRVADVSAKASALTEGDAFGSAGKRAHAISSAIHRGSQHAQRYHEIAERYHDKGQQLVSPLNAYRF